MPRGKLPFPTKPRLANLSLPGELLAQLDILLYSEAELKVPYGAYSQFFAARLREWLAYERLDLAPFLGTVPETFVVTGDPTVIAALRAKLEEPPK